MVKEYQLDPVTHQLLHADFYQLAMDRAITVTVPILVIGEPKGAKLQGGMLDFVTRDVQVQCLPKDIPEHIDVDVSGADAPPGRPAARPAGEPEVEGDERPGHDARPRRPAEGRGGGGDAGGGSGAAAAVPGAPAEPEVIKKGKTEKEGGAGEEVTDRGRTD